MAPKKKNGGRSNNSKKKKGKSGITMSQDSSSTARQNRTTNTSSPDDRIDMIKTLPTFHKKTSVNDEKFSSSSSIGGHYEIYKRSTTAFWGWMKETLPHAKMTAVNDLRKGADAILERNIQSLDETPPNPIVAPKEILEELSVSIEYRELLTSTLFAGNTGNTAGSSTTGRTGDKGHAYMIEILRYCRSVLRFGRHIAKVAILEDNLKTASTSTGEDGTADQFFDGIGGRFNALVLENDEDEDEEDLEAEEDDIRNRKFRTFEIPTHNQEIDIQQDLIDGDDRFQAIALLQTMEHSMGAVNQHYRLLKENLRGMDRHDGSSLQLLMECSVVANMATQSVHTAENSLMTNHQHLSSFYHVLAVVFLTNFVADITQLIDKIKQEREPHMALKFVGDIIECSFHNRGRERLPGIMTKFARKSGLSLQTVQEHAEQIHTLVAHETQLALEEPMNAPMNRLFATNGLHPHTWLSQSSYIGGDACILNTQNIVQKLMDAVEDQQKLVAKPGFWGPQFNEITNPAESIRGGLDEALAGSVMPELMAICMNAPFHCLPERAQLMTVIDLLHHHVSEDRTRPIPVALSFGLHAILTSIMVLQGDGDLARIASFTKQSYNTLFSQLDAELGNPLDSPTQPQNAPNFYFNVALFRNLVNFAKPASSKYDTRITFLDPAIAEGLAFWNPLIGGEYMLYGSYMCSIGLGSATVDSMGQLRFTLHLYNALKQHDPSIDVPFLQTLDKIFSKTRAVWVGGRPEKGSYCKHFWLAWGLSISEASKIGSDTASDGFMPSLMQSRGNLTRDLDEILPEEYSASYRRLVQQVFTDEDGVADYMTLNSTHKEGEKHQRHYAGLFALLTRVNMTRDAMDKDEDLLKLNLSAVGCILLEFTNALSKHMGWDEVLNTAMAAYPECMRTGKTMGGRKMKPGSFNTSDNNMKRQGMAHMWGAMLSRLDSSGDDDDGTTKMETDKAVAFMISYFQNVAKERYTFFIEKEEEQPKETRRSPLEGSYPYGRTGKTSRDPFAGFFHFKYSKRGEPVARLIKPGKCTPYHPTASGDVATPYEEQGSKMKRAPSGKYRHIASYTINELTELGWDGAMYSATHGRHAAIGLYVPFICGYDSDADDDYEPINIQVGRRAGTIGLPPDETGRYMEIPDIRNQGQRQLVQLNKSR